MSLLDATFACAKCGSLYPVGCTHHCPTFVSLPIRWTWKAPPPEVALRAEVERLTARVAELEGRG